MIVAVVVIDLVAESDFDLELMVEFVVEFDFVRAESIYHHLHLVESMHFDFELVDFVVDFDLVFELVELVDFVPEESMHLIDYQSLDFVLDFEFDLELVFESEHLLHLLQNYQASRIR